MQRYFVNEIVNEQFVFDDNQIHHITRVMRMKEEDEIEVCFSNEVFLCKISSISPLKVRIVEKYSINNELPNKVTLLYCLPKGEKLDLVIQKATELGVYEIILVQSERCITKYKKEDFEKKLLRFNKIALEASEQSKRNSSPIINKIINYKDIKNYSFDKKFIAYEKEIDGTFYEKLKDIKKDETISILIGSEGGFSAQEVDFAIECGYYSISLGKRILRSETAVFFALSAIAFSLERNG